MMITSAANPTVRRWRELQTRQGRREQQAYLIEGVRLVEEALVRRTGLQALLLAPELLGETARGRTLLAALTTQPLAAEYQEFSARAFRAMVETETPSGVAAVLKLPEAQDLDSLPHTTGLLVVLDGVQDPGNAGTILRTAAAAAADAVIALQGCVDLYAPKVVRSAMGAHLSLPLAVDIPIQLLSEWLPTRGRIFLAEGSASESLYSQDLTRPSVFLMGGEANGAQQATLLPALTAVAIPMPGGTESLNVAVATAVMLFEAVRQRQAASS